MRGQEGAGAGAGGGRSSIDFRLFSLLFSIGYLLGRYFEVGSPFAFTLRVCSPSTNQPLRHPPTHPQFHHPHIQILSLSNFSKEKKNTGNFPEKKERKKKNELKFKAGYQSLFAQKVRKKERERGGEGNRFLKLEFLKMMI